MGYVLWTTSNCNLNCIYCYENHGRQKNQGNIGEDILNYFSKCEKDDLKQISFHGGEPLINYKLIDDVVNYCNRERELSTTFSFTTNGTQWNEEIERILFENQQAFQYGISLSIDGLPKVHDFCRKDKKGNGTYKEVVKVKNKLIKKFPNICARMTITPENVQFLFENIKHLNNIGFNTISSMVDLFDERWDNNLMEIFSSEYEKVIEYWIQNKHLELSLVDSLFKKSYGFCKLSYNIYVDGNIYPCTYVAGNKNFIVGDLKSGINYKKSHQCMEECKKDYLQCQECAINRNCIYNRCKYMNYAIYNNYNMPSIIGCCIENIQIKLRDKYADELCL